MNLQTSDFDYEQKSIRYSFIQGNGKIVMIETGRGGSIYGYQNKYLKIAHEIKRRFGYSVIVFSNPIDSVCSLPDDLQTAFDLIGSRQEVLYVGISNGALVGIQQGWNIDCLKKMLLINGPLMMNWHKTKHGILHFAGETLCFVYGGKDPSYQYTPFLKRIAVPNLELKIIENADHHFAGMEVAFMETILTFINEAV